MPLSQIRDLLGHASIVTTERYDTQRPEALMAAATLLEPVAEVSTQTDAATAAQTEAPDDADANFLADEEMSGVDDGIRTRNFRSHSPALYP